MTVDEVQKRFSWSSGRATDALETLLEVCHWCWFFYSIQYFCSVSVSYLFALANETLLGKYRKDLQ